MKITNKFNLPQPLVNAANRDDYTMGDARMSVTGLLRPPRITLLTKRHSPDIEVDVSDMIWSLFGRAVHSILEKGGDEEHLPEERLFMEVRGWRISGAIDVQRITVRGNTPVVRITDYKVCKAYSVMNEKVDWENQLNLYAHLIREVKGYEVEGLQICGLVRDWDRNKAASDPDYPQASAVTVPVNLWPPAAAKAFIEERVRVHQSAIAAADMGEELPPCSEEDMWTRKETWAVRKRANKRPNKVFDIRGEAEAYQTQMGDDYVIEHRPGEPIRCTGNYCNVAPWCSQYAKWKP